MGNRIGSTTHDEKGSVLAEDVLMGAYLRIMVRERGTVLNQEAFEVVVYKTCHKSDELPLLTIQYKADKKGDMIPLNQGLAEKIAKRIKNNPYKYFHMDITPKEYLMPRRGND